MRKRPLLINCSKFLPDAFALWTKINTDIYHRHLARNIGYIRNNRRLFHRQRWQRAKTVDFYKKSLEYNLLTWYVHGTINDTFLWTASTLKYWNLESYNAKIAINKTDKSKRNKGIETWRYLIFWRIATNSMKKIAIFSPGDLAKWKRVKNKMFTISTWQKLNYLFIHING